MTHRNGTKPGHLGRGDFAEVTEGTIVASLSVVLVYLIHQRWDLPVEIESAVMVVVYGVVRLAWRWISDTTVTPKKNDEGSGDESEDDEPVPVTIEGESDGDAGAD